MNGEAVSDVNVKDIIVNGCNNGLVWKPFDVEKGPLCRFGIEEGSTILIKSLYDSIADGRLLELLLNG